MNSWAWALMWCGVGIGMSVVHWQMLRLSVARAASLPIDKAGAAIVRGLPLRLLLWVPALVFAAKGGLWACVGLVLGSFVGRWVLCSLSAGQSRPIWSSQRKG